MRNANENDLPNPILELIQIYSDKMAMSVKCNALVAYPVHAVWLIFTAKGTRYLALRELTLLGFPPAGSAEVETEDMEGGADTDVSQFRSTSFKTMSLQKLKFFYIFDSLLERASLCAQRGDAFYTRTVEIMLLNEV